MVSVLPPPTEYQLKLSLRTAVHCKLHNAPSYRLFFMHCNSTLCAAFASSLLSAFANTTYYSVPMVPHGAFNVGEHVTLHFYFLSGTHPERPGGGGGRTAGVQFKMELGL